MKRLAAEVAAALAVVLAWGLAGVAFCYGGWRVGGFWGFAAAFVIWEFGSVLALAAYDERRGP